MFDGITVNCNKFEEFAANAMCDWIRNEPSGLIPQEDNTFKFSLFGAVRIEDFTILLSYYSSSYYKISLREIKLFLLKNRGMEQ